MIVKLIHTHNLNIHAPLFILKAIMAKTLNQSILCFLVILCFNDSTLLKFNQNKK